MNSDEPQDEKNVPCDDEDSASKASEENDYDVVVQAASGGKGKKKRDGSTLRKAPQAPKRFKSSYILFFMAKQKEIKDAIGSDASVGEVSKRSSEIWKSLSSDERAYWDNDATKDKQRYMAEKAVYTGPWQVPWKRAKKDPSAPKRPMSAFLFFSQDKRRRIKEQNPGMRNTEVSRVLGDMWRNASDDERNPHIEREAREREKYKVSIAKWRKEDEEKKDALKKEQEEQARFAAMHSTYPVLAQQDEQAEPSPPYYHHQHPSYGGGYDLNNCSSAYGGPLPPSHYNSYAPPTYLPPQSHQDGYSYSYSPHHSHHILPSVKSSSSHDPSGASAFLPLQHGGYYQPPHSQGYDYGEHSSAAYPYQGEYDSFAHH